MKNEGCLRIFKAEIPDPDLHCSCYNSYNRLRRFICNSSTNICSDLNRITQGQLRSDFIELLYNIEMVYDAPFNTISRDTIVKLFEERIADGKEDYSLFEAYKLFS